MSCFSITLEKITQEQLTATTQQNSHQSISAFNQKFALTGKLCCSGSVGGLTTQSGGFLKLHRKTRVFNQNLTRSDQSASARASRSLAGRSRAGTARCTWDTPSSDSPRAPQTCSGRSWAETSRRREGTSCARQSCARRRTERRKETVISPVIAKENVKVGSCCHQC